MQILLSDNFWYMVVAGRGVVRLSRKILLCLRLPMIVIDIMGNNCSLKVCVKKERRSCNA